MKYLKQYKIFESLDYHLKVVKDLLSDISDDDTPVDISNNLDSRKDSIPVGIFILIGCHPDELPTGNINISKYKSSLDRVNEYLKSEGFKLIGFCGETDEEEYIHRESDTYTIDQLINEISSKSMMYITLHYYILEDDAHLEKIEVPIEVGDTVLGGRFKNKKMVVKKIGKNKKGDITINDKPLLKFRLMRESLQDDINYYFGHLEDDDFVIHSDEDKDYIRIFKPIKMSNSRGNLEYSYSNCKPFQWSEISGEVERYVDELDEDVISYVYILRVVSKTMLRDEVSIESLLDGSFNAGEILSFTIGLK